VLLENAGKNEQISFETGLKGCQIEHIMPQRLSSAWSQISERDHQRYLHKLGNLSITFDNASLGNVGFDEKKDKLAKLSRVRLNQMLLEYASFGPQEIQDRSTRLLEQFFEAYDLFDEHGAEEESEDLDNKVTPQQWIEMVRKQGEAPELVGLSFAVSWKAVCNHLDIPVGQDSAHRRLEKWRCLNRPMWPTSGAP
jgi:hypothetical protein